MHLCKVKSEAMISILEARCLFLSYRYSYIINHKLKSDICSYMCYLSCFIHWWYFVIDFSVVIWQLGNRFMCGRPGIESSTHLKSHVTLFCFTYPFNHVINHKYKSVICTRCPDSCTGCFECENSLMLYWWTANVTRRFIILDF